ncbi:tetratricopeptide repeat protein [Aggregicoccus sp. 17bor-14]|uniref:tetratricopeptide repeat protein n=1 Tax=Myxococcaceae TaxID=31 RepID=UPI00129CC1EC|nr:MULTISPECIES: tetratricopeptide repeat protein [Myxococcaceae]MBF5041715.1 tetratricopeptide repeat protein [Simulacricoccus sp. 17bor-14]MRI87496.1 tetratricopeptide repeat protein [Aggregicoccus sp. 17bor-14]
MTTAHAREGNQQWAQGQVDAALRSFQKGLALEPQDVDCLLGLVRCHGAQGAHAAAEASARRLLALRPDHAEGQARLALARARQGDAEALEALRALAAAPSAGFGERFELALLLLERADAAGAEVALRLALERDPDSGPAHFERGRLALARQDGEAAFAHLARAAELTRDEPMVLLFLGRAHALRGELGRALAVVGRAAAAAPASAPLREELLRLALAAGHPEAAVRAARELRALTPGSAHAVYLEGLAQLASGQFPQAAELLQEAVSQGLPTALARTEAQLALARALGGQGQQGEARALLERVLAEGAAGSAQLEAQARTLLGQLSG